MFAKAIHVVGDYTRPILMISREYNSREIIPGAATAFFVNDEGCAITCRHVAEMIIDADRVNSEFCSFKQEIKNIADGASRKSEYKKIEKKYGYCPGRTIERKNNFINCFDKFSAIDCILHPEYDLAILRFRGYEKLLYKGHAVFAERGDSIQPGDFLCRLGFPFPEFTGFLYNEEADCIEWDFNGNLSTPRFPIEGMLTRHISGKNGETIGYELSTPGLRGQSGGPLFNADGIVYGIQSKTKHLHLGFDMNKKSMPINGKNQMINNQPFLHVGECVHIDLIKRFLKENHIRYYVGNSLDNAVAVEE